MKTYLKFFLLIALFLIGYLFVLAYTKYTDNQAIYLRISGPHRAIKKLSNVFYLPYYFKKNRLPQYELIIRKKDLEQLNDNLPDIYVPEKVILTSEYKKYQPAVFKYEDKEYKVRVRYRGDSVRHWAHNKKSWLVNFADDDLFFGKKKIHLLVPETRDFLVEELNYHRADKFNLLVPESKFVNLEINGKKKAIYWEVEDIDDSFLERQGVSSDSNFYVTKDFDSSFYDSIRYWRKEVRNKNFEFSDFKELELLLNSIGEETPVSQDIFNLIDKQSFFSWQKLAFLAASNHLAGSNSKIYFNADSGRFEFVPWNVDLFPYKGGTDRKLDEISAKIFANPEIYREFQKFIYEYLSDEKNLQDDLDYYDKKWQEIKIALYQDRIKNKSNFEVGRVIREKRQLAIDDFLKLKKELEGNLPIVSIEEGRGDVLGIIKFNGKEAPLLIEKAVLTLESEEVELDFSLHYDKNSNFKLDNSDIYLSKLSTDDDKLFYAQNLNFEINPSYQLIDEGDPFPKLKLVPGSANFLIVNNTKNQYVKDIYELTKGIKFDILNTTTGQSFNLIYKND